MESRPDVSTRHHAGHPDCLAQFPQPCGPARWRAVLQVPRPGPVSSGPPPYPLHLISAQAPPKQQPKAPETVMGAGPVPTDCPLLAAPRRVTWLV